MFAGRSIAHAMVKRAQANGIEALVLTADCSVVPKRAYNARNGFTVPSRLSRRSAFDMLTHSLDLGTQFRLTWQVQLVFAGKDLLILLRLHMVHDGVVLFAAQEASRNSDTTYSIVGTSKKQPTISQKPISNFKPAKY